MSVIAEFKINYTQFLNEEGKTVAELPAIAKNADNLIALYKTMLLTRSFDAKAVALQRTGYLGTYAGQLGQEAIGACIGHLMQKDDVFVPAYREYAAMFQRGVKLTHILQYWGGDERGNNFDNPHDMPLCVPIASQTLHAVGIAKALQLRQQKNIAVTMVGDGGTSQGDFYEALNVAGAWNLPVVFVINNNQWAISVSRKNQCAAETLAQKGLAAGLHCEQVDGNDVIALSKVIGDAIERSRRGEKPTVIEAMTYRLCDHTTADDMSRYAPKAEIEAAWKKEPIKRLKIYLLAQKMWDEDQDQALLKEINSTVQQAAEDYVKQQPQPAEAMFDYLYAELPDALADQYANVIASAPLKENNHA